jgi:hypothetical protein
LNQEDINNLNSSVKSNEIETVMKKHPRKKSPGPDGFSAKFYQIFIELTPWSSNYFKKYRGKEYYQSCSTRSVLS